jgi:hypothetical protein
MRNEKKMRGAFFEFLFIGSIFLLAPSETRSEGKAEGSLPDIGPAILSLLCFLLPARGLLLLT